MFDGMETDSSKKVPVLKEHQFFSKCMETLQGSLVGLTNTEQEAFYKMVVKKHQQIKKKEMDGEEAFLDVQLELAKINSKKNQT